MEISWRHEERRLKVGRQIARGGLVATIPREEGCLGDVRGYSGPAEDLMRLPPFVPERSACAMVTARNSRP